MQTLRFVDFSEATCVIEETEHSITLTIHGDRIAVVRENDSSQKKVRKPTKVPSRKRR